MQHAAAAAAASDGDFVVACSDVDVAEPDEKSLITYVSSLYDVFPDVPSMEQSMRDNVCILIYTLLISLLSLVLSAYYCLTNN